MSGLEAYLDQVVVGDVLDVLRALPDNCIDISVTSPPYNKKENKKGWLVTNVRYAHSTDRMPEAQYQAWQIQVLNEVFRVTKPGGPASIITKSAGKTVSYTTLTPGCPSLRGFCGRRSFGIG